MIHTFKLMFVLNYQEVQDLQRRLGIKYTELNTYFNGAFPGVTMAITNSGNGQWKLYMVVDAIQLLGQSDLTEDDYPSLEREIKYILLNVLGTSANHHYRNHILLRIDYRYDIPIPDKGARLLLMNLYKKQTKSHRFQKRNLGKLRNNVFVPYKTTVYHSSNSMESMVYLKQEERENEGAEVMDYEMNVVRYEVHVMRDHLYYMERKNERNPRPRKLGEYMKDDVYKDYFRKYMNQIYHPGVFCKIDEARNRLTNSTLPSTSKRKLIEFLKVVSTHNIDTPLKRMTKATFKNRLALLEKVGINPILIPKNYTSNNPTFKAPSYLKNPLDDFPW